MQEMFDASKAYDIDLRGLGLGNHHFEFEVGGALFAQYEECEVLDGDLRCEVDMDRSESLMDLQISIEGVVSVECDRCLEACELEVDYESPLIVRLCDDELLQSAQEEQQGDGDVMWISRSATTLELTHYIYESIMLSLPYQRVHPEGECSPEMMKHFKIISNEEFEQIEEQSEEPEMEGLSPEAQAKLQALKEQMMK